MRMGHVRACGMQSAALENKLRDILSFWQGQAESLFLTVKKWENEAGK